MALNVAKWSDKQLDELKDMLASADSSIAALFVIGGFLVTGSKVMTDATDTTLRIKANIPANGGVNISPGVFIHNNLSGNNKAGQLDSTQLVNIISNIGGWGTAQVADLSDPRWDIICVKNAEIDHTQENRWFVDDSVTPNTYAEQLTNTLIDKTYYDIIVEHGTPGSPPTFPVVPAGYFCIAEVYVGAGVATITDTDIYDTAGISQATPAHWDINTRVLRLEYGVSAFRVDHDPATGHHRAGAWHIGAVVITATGVEINQALHGIGGTVTATNLNSLTDGGVLASGVLHSHGGTPRYYILIQDEKPSGTQGGVFNAGAWRTRDLNIIKTDDTGVVTLAGNQFTLPTGTYTCDITAPGLACDTHKIRLRNITDNVTVVVGQSSYSQWLPAPGVNEWSDAVAKGKFTIVAPKIFEVQHWCAHSDAYGFGVATNCGEVEVYTVAQLWKL